MTPVLDASALLAYLQREPGFERVGAVLDHACISSVNWSEVLQKCARNGIDTVPVATYLTEIGLTVEIFTASQAKRAADLWSQTRALGLSLADRACLALAMEKSVPALTADKAWLDLELPIAIELIR